MKETSIIVLYYNKINLTLKCIKSILDAGYEPEIIYAFDNGSKTENHEIIRSTFTAINHFREEKNFGYSGGFNKAVNWAISKGKTNFLFLTNDTKITKKCLENIFIHSEKSNSEFVAPKIVYEYSPDKIDSIGGYFNKNIFSLGHYKDEKQPLFLNTEFDYVPGTALWFTKKVFNKINGMDESYHTYWEDVDFSFRAHRAEIKISRCYDALISHGVGKTCHKKPLYSTYYFQRNRIRFCKKYLPADLIPAAKESIRTDIRNIEIKSNSDETKLGYIKELLAELEYM